MRILDLLRSARSDAVVWSSAWVLLAIAAPIAAPVAAEEISPGVTYDGSAWVEVAEYGIAFQVPEGWQGTLTEDGEAFRMISSQFAGLLLATAEADGAEKTRQQMIGPIPLGGGVVLEPRGELETRSGSVGREFTVRGADPPLAAYARAIDRQGLGVVFLALVPAEQISQGRRWVDGLHASLRSTDRPPEPQPAGETSEAGSSDRWDDYLAGKHLVRFYTTTGYTSERHLWLCSNGSFRYQDESGGFGGGASGAFAAAYQGRWTATGVGDRGELRLVYDDGSTADYQLSYADDKVFLDDDRWLRAGNDLCD